MGGKTSSDLLHLFSENASQGGWEIFKNLLSPYSWRLGVRYLAPYPQSDVFGSCAKGGELGGVPGCLSLHGGPGHNHCQFSLSQSADAQALGPLIHLLGSGYSDPCTSKLDFCKSL